MNDTQNNLTFLDPLILKRMRKNKNSSLSTMFRDFRRRVPLIGDYPVIKHIVNVCTENGWKFNRNQAQLACQNSVEYKEFSLGEKSRWIRDFML